MNAVCEPVTACPLADVAGVRLTWGKKYRGMLLADVPTDYLAWSIVSAAIKLTRQPLLWQVKSELQRRGFTVEFDEFDREAAADFAAKLAAAERTTVLAALDKLADLAWKGTGPHVTTELLIAESGIPTERAKAALRELCDDAVVCTGFAGLIRNPKKRKKGKR